MTNPIGPVKYVKISEGINTILGIKYFFPSLTIQAPANKLMDKKCSQKINNKASLANIAYNPSRPLYNSKPSNILPSLKRPYER